MEKNTYPVIEVGMIVKSYDFPSSRDCFMVGKVLSIHESYGLMTIEKMFKVWEGKCIDTMSSTFQTPVDGDLITDSPDRPRIVPYTI